MRTQSIPLSHHGMFQGDLDKKKQSEDDFNLLACVGTKKEEASNGFHLHFFPIHMVSEHFW